MLFKSTERDGIVLSGSVSKSNNSITPVHLCGNMVGSLCNWGLRLCVRLCLSACVGAGGVIGCVCVRLCGLIFTTLCPLPLSPPHVAGGVHTRVQVQGVGV